MLDDTFGTISNAKLNESSEEEIGGGTCARRFYTNSRKKKRRERNFLSKGKLFQEDLVGENEGEVALSTPVKRIALIGLRGVGKSAIAVRHITNRFIGEYSSGEELYLCKKRKTTFSYELVVQSPTLSQASLSTLRENMDGFLIVYDVTSRESFNYARNILESLRSEENFPEDVHRGSPVPQTPLDQIGGSHHSLSDDEVFYKMNLSTPFCGQGKPSSRDFRSLSFPVTVLGNKRDLDHRRQISVEEAQRLSLENDCNFLEISTAESSVGPNLAIQMILRELAFLHREKRTDDTPIKARENIGFPSFRNEEEMKHHFKEFSNESSFSSRSSSCSSHKSSSNYSSCSSCSSSKHRKSNSLKRHFKVRDWNEPGSTDSKGILSDMKSTIGSIFYNSLSRKSGRKPIFS